MWNQVLGFSDTDDENDDRCDDDCSDVPRQHGNRLHLPTAAVSTIMFASWLLPMYHHIFPHAHSPCCYVWHPVLHI